MTYSTSDHRQLDAVSALFAAALDGNAHAEHQLRELAVHDDRAADALWAVASSSVVEATPARPADVAATDQMIAAVLDVVHGTDWRR